MAHTDAPSGLTNLFPEGSGPEGSSADWAARAGKALKGAPLSSLDTVTEDGITAAALAGTVQASPIPERPEGAPLIGAIATEADPKAANATILTDLEGGAEALTLSLAAPGLAGLTTSEEALDIALDGIFLEAISFSLRGPGALGNGTPTVWSLWQERSIAAADRRGCFGIDPLGWLAAGAAGSEVSGVLEAPHKAVALAEGQPNVRALLASGLPYHDAGATAAQELACVLATGVAYSRAAAASGTAVESAFSNTELELAVDADLFGSVAKLRAMRLLWRRVLDLSQVDNEPVWIGAQTSARMMSAQDIAVNMLRNSTAALAAGIGGAQAVSVLPHTHPAGQPDAASRRLARNTALILREESTIGAVEDAAAGAGAIEHLTDGLCAKAWTLFQEIERAGGMAAALKGGLVRGWIVQAAADRAEAEENQMIVRVGVNRFQNIEDTRAALRSWVIPPALITDFALTQGDTS